MKTHQELGITAEEHKALIATLDVLRQEQIVFDMGMPCYLPYDKMNEIGEVPFCDTNCCIGGSMSLIMQNGGSLPQRVNKNMRDVADEYLDKHGYGSKSNLYHLFYDNTDDQTKPSDGVRAVENFLNGNITAPWDFYHPDGYSEMDEDD